MDKTAFVSRLGYFNLVHGVTVRAVAAFSDHELAYRPQPAMRSPRELVFHIYKQEQLIAEACRAGRFSLDAANASNPEDPANAAALQALATVADTRAFAETCHRTADATFKAMSDDELSRPVESPMGNYPAWQFFGFAYDEHWHHPRPAVHVPAAPRQGTADALRLLNATGSLHAE